MQLNEIAVDFWLRPIHPEDMPSLATRMLLDGYDAPSLREVAGLTAKDDPRAIHDTFRQALVELGAWLPDYATAQVHAGVLASRDLLAGRISIDECASRVRAVCEFDEVIYNALPSDIDELAAMSWVLLGDEYDRDGGDERLLRAARVVAARDTPR